MSTSNIKYSNAISKSVIVDSIYVDTSFIFDLILIQTNPKEFTDRRYKDTKAFHTYLLQKRVEIWTSYLSVQEIMHKRFAYELHKEIRIFEKKSNLPSFSMNYNKFKRQDPKAFKELFLKFKPIFEATFLFVIRSGVKIKIPRDFSFIHSVSKGERIARFAKCLLDRYVLEVADAFHISTARCAGTKHIATNDIGFKQVDNIIVFSFV